MQGNSEQKIRAVLQRARERGVDPVMELSAAGLVLTEETRRQVARETILEMATLIEQSPLELWLRKGAMTVAAFRGSLVQWLREQAGVKQ